MMAGSAASCSRQRRSLMTTTGWAPISFSSAGRKNRPSSGRVPSIVKKLAETSWVNTRWLREPELNPVSSPVKAHNWENWRDRLREALSTLFPGPLWLVYE